MHALEASVPDRGRKVFIEGLISLSNHPIRTLFDSGASHSFISDSVVESSHLSTSMLSDPVVVSNPIRGKTHLCMICLGLRISVLGIEFECDTFVLGFMGYDLILGMDWLAMYGAILDCEWRVVRLLTCRRRTLEIFCDPRGSVMLSFLESLDAYVNDLQSLPIVYE